MGSRWSSVRLLLSEEEMAMAKQRREVRGVEREPVRDQVTRRMATLKGSSRNDLVGDRDRGASSPLGHGKRVKEKR